MQAPIMDRALQAARTTCNRPATVLALTPQGRRFDDTMARELALLSDKQDLVLIAGRYEGFDERFIAESVDTEISVGDFVVSGGELPAMLVLDAIIRLLPDVLGHQSSAREDSFAEGLLDCPHYTRPEVYRGMSVPPVLLSGNHKAIAEWRRAQSVHRTLQRRPDLLTPAELSVEDQALLAAWQLVLPDN
jgi:tRNA (guanine37-N1)-methyltransferase